MMGFLPVFSIPESFQRFLLESPMHTTYSTLFCIGLGFAWLFLRRKIKTVQPKQRNPAVNGTCTTATETTNDKTVRFALKNTVRRATSSSFWRSTRSMDDTNSGNFIGRGGARIRLYSDPGTDRLDHQSDMELLERTQQKHYVVATPTPPTTTNRTKRGRRRLSSTITPNVPAATAAATAATSISPTTISYATWVPPPTWNETRRRTFRPAHTFSQTLTFHLDTCQLKGVNNNNTNTNTDDGKSKTKEAALSSSSGGSGSIWVCPTERVEAGVLQVYTEQSPDDPTEHSFRTAQAAAQFQWDWIALQTLGPQIYHLYRVLALVQQGSQACVFTESVLHDACPTEATAPYVAWDDAMRCLGMYFPSIRFRLEALHALKDTERLSSSNINSSDNDLSSDGLVPSYQTKRLLLRLVDFFRLFVPQLPSTALPERDCSRLRMERLLKTRKRVAKAAVLIQTYVQAQTIVHRGWTVSSPDYAWQRRLAYDTNWDNAQHDSAAQHEFYEASVSRDIHVVHNKSCCGYQGYSLVGMHSFRWNTDVPIQDPVKAFPSIQALMQQKQYGCQHFWVQSFYLETRRVVCVQVFVRSLAPSVDRQFDAAMEQLGRSDAPYRDAQLSLHVQLGLALEGLSLVGSFLLLLLTTILKRWAPPATISGLTSAADIVGRTSLPGLRLSKVSDTYHYGDFTTNYLACASVWGPSQHNRSILSNVLLSYLECGIFSMIVADMTLVLKDAPQRALCTARIVREPTTPVDPATDGTLQQPAKPRTVVWNLLVMDPLRRFLKHLFLRKGGTSDEMQQRSVVVSPATSAPFCGDDNAAEEDVLTKIPLTQSVYIEQCVTKILEILQSLEYQRNDVQHGFFREVSRHDVLRHFMAEQCSLRRTLARIVASTKWRRSTFPIDTRACRIELQNRQFFQNGFDRKGRPIFCFRSTLLGPWRKNEDALIDSVLYTFDESIQRLSRLQPFLQCVLIVVLGRSGKNRNRAPTEESDSREAELVPPDDALYEQATFDSTVSSEAAHTQHLTKAVPRGRSTPPVCLTWDNCSPRVHSDEIPTNHTNHGAVTKLINILLAHYPGRLHRAFVVVGHHNGYIRSKLEGKLSLPSFVSAPATREKVKFLSRLSDLNGYFDFSGCGDFVDDDVAEPFEANDGNVMVSNGIIEEEEQEQEGDDDNTEILI